MEMKRMDRRRKARNIRALTFPWLQLQGEKEKNVNDMAESSHELM
jgi:hypothetical protein